MATWLADSMGDSWVVRSDVAEDLGHVVAVLPIGGRLDRYAFIDLGEGWTALLTDGPLGTDVGVLPSWIARTMDAVAIRATSVDAVASGRYAAQILEVFDPEAADNRSRRRRTLVAADDGGTWTVESSGEPYEFELDDLVHGDGNGPRIREAPLDAARLQHFVAALGVPELRDGPVRVTYVERRNEPSK